MRKLILLLGLVLQVIIVNAQSVSGSLVDEKGNPVSFANVLPRPFLSDTVVKLPFCLFICKYSIYIIYSVCYYFFSFFNSL